MPYTFCTVAPEAVDIVDAYASISAWIRKAFVNVHLTESTYSKATMSFNFYMSLSHGPGYLQV
jgi:hypothetical protein